MVNDPPTPTLPVRSEYPLTLNPPEAKSKPVVVKEAPTPTLPEVTKDPPTPMFPKFPVPVTCRANAGLVVPTPTLPALVTTKALLAGLI